MASLFQQIFEDPSKFTFICENLGECKIESPLRNSTFVEEADKYSLLSVRAGYIHQFMTAYGSVPKLESCGPHRKIFHDPATTRAAIVTAGGLCPGLNNVIKGLVEVLAFDYGIKTIYGFRYGYAGLIPEFGYEPMMLTPDVVDTIHEDGGTLLGSSRGQQDTTRMVDTLERMNINVFFAIGGDGSLRCARDVSNECRRRGLKISVVGIPKTIDNDLHFVGRSFGFETAVAQAVPAIRAAHSEALGAHHGIGLVKLMGRDSGFIAAYAALANPVVNFCLIPESPFTVDGEKGLLAALERRFASGKNHAVIVVAEGAGQELMEGTMKKDASGNILKKDIGEFIKNAIVDHFKSKDDDVTVKYIDPSYTIRSCPADASDAVLCYRLARMAVHAAMAGRTNCVVGRLNDDFSLAPIPLATIERRKVELTSNLWNSVLDATGQEYYLNPEVGTPTATYAP
ncbi:MAG: ATP-dependent 6-phosphofructokinase [Kiritimatiellia bacterium]